MATCFIPKIVQFHNPLFCIHNRKSPKSQKPILAGSSNVQEPSSTGSVSVKEKNTFPGKPEADVVVIGSGIGGLCCGGLLARYQQDVIVLESHDIPGGAAHSFDIKGYKFDSGPSLFSGFQSRGPQANPLAQVTSLFIAFVALLFVGAELISPLVVQVFSSVPDTEMPQCSKNN